MNFVGALATIGVDTAKNELSKASQLELECQWASIGEDRVHAAQAPLSAEGGVRLAFVFALLFRPSSCCFALGFPRRHAGVH